MLLIINIIGFYWSLLIYFNIRIWILNLLLGWTCIPKTDIWFVWRSYNINDILFFTVSWCEWFSGGNTVVRINPVWTTKIDILWYISFYSTSLSNYCCFLRYGLNLSIDILAMWWRSHPIYIHSRTDGFRNNILFTSDLFGVTVTIRTIMYFCRISLTHFFVCKFVWV